MGRRHTFCGEVMRLGEVGWMVSGDAVRCVRVDGGKRASRGGSRVIGGGGVGRGGALLAMALLTNLGGVGEQRGR